VVTAENRVACERPAEKPLRNTNADYFNAVPRNQLPKYAVPRNQLPKELMPKYSAEREASVLTWPPTESHYDLAHHLLLYMFGSRVSGDKSQRSSIGRLTLRESFPEKTIEYLWSYLYTLWGVPSDYF
jgi:hypothetical protein